MRIIYTPEGGSKRTWDLDLENPDWDVSYSTEKATGWPWLPFREKLGGGSSIALQALVWTLRKREEPRLELAAVTPSWSEVEVEADEDEPAADSVEESGPSQESGEA